MNEEFSLGCLLVILWRCENEGECILHTLTCLYARQRLEGFFSFTNKYKGKMMGKL